MFLHFNIKIFGLVQGVFFRVSAKKEADRLKLSGLARNDTDGSVYIEVEGDKDSLDRFISWCKKGPPQAKVEKVQYDNGEIKNYQQFKIN